MSPHVHAVVVPSELSEFTDEIRRIFLELGRSLSADVFAGECSPPLDVLETDEAVEITVDLPGVDPSSIRVVIRGSGVLIAGEKATHRALRDSSFHLVERGYGRFARTTRLGTACDAAHARAVMKHGELRITIPKIGERRGQRISVPVETGDRRPA